MVSTSRSTTSGPEISTPHPLGPFVADFFCETHNLVIELDGRSHNDRADSDQERTAYLEQQGFRVLRVLNDDVLSDLDAVLATILKACGINPFAD